MGSRKRRTRLNLALFCALSLALAGCGGGGSSGSSADGADDSDSPGGNTSGPATISGVAQKGPFQPGGTATATRLADDGSLTSEEVTGTIETDGSFSLPSIDWNGATEVTLSGTWFDEVAGSFGSESWQLEAVAAASGTVDVNVNLFTHIAAARVRTLMAGGDSFTDALSQARSEIRSLLGIDSDPGALDLLSAAANPDEADGASLLLFSAAVIDAGLTQGDVDAIAADFGDDGRINGNGQSAYSSVQQAATETLLDTARTNLQNQYSEEPPDLGGGGSTGWQLSACESAKLTEPRVFCAEETFEGTQGDDGGEPILFYPPEDGYYAFALSDEDGELFGGGWTVYAGRDFSSGEVGDSFNDDSPPYEDVTSLALDADEPYAIQANLNGLEQSGDSFTLVAHQVSEGAGYTPVEVEVGETHEARVGELFVNGTTGGPATSWYRFTSAGGSYTIETSNYAADTGSGGFRIEVFEGESGQENVNDLNALTDLGFENPDGTASTSITVTPDAGRTVFVLVTNQFTDFRRSNFRPDAGWIEFSLQITEAD